MAPASRRLVLLLLAVPAAAPAQSAAPAPPVVRATGQASRIDAAPRLDGRLDDAAWLAAGFQVTTLGRGLLC